MPLVLLQLSEPSDYEEEDSDSMEENDEAAPSNEVV